MEITREQVREYINKNFDSFFVEALAKYVYDVICPPEGRDEESMQEYRTELKNLIFDAISAGVKEYLNECEDEAIKIISEKFFEKFSNREISIHFD